MVTAAYATGILIIAAIITTIMSLQAQIYNLNKWIQTCGVYICSAEHRDIYCGSGQMMMWSDLHDKLIAPGSKCFNLEVTLCCVDILGHLKGPGNRVCGRTHPCGCGSGVQAWLFNQAHISPLRQCPWLWGGCSFLQYVGACAERIYSSGSESSV